jgi:hypothetical protein
MHFQCSTVIGCFVIIWSRLVRCPASHVAYIGRWASNFFCVPSYWSLSRSRNFTYVMGPEHVFVLIGPCLEPDQSTPAPTHFSHIRQPPWSCYSLQVSRNFMWIEVWSLWGCFVSLGEDIPAFRKIAVPSSSGPSSQAAWRVLLDCFTPKMTAPRSFRSVGNYQTNDTE